MAATTITLILDGHAIGTADIHADRRGVPGAVIDKAGTVLVPVTARLTGVREQSATPTTR